MVTIAVAQIKPEFGNVAGNVELTVDAARRAHDAGAEILVLPELVNTGYMFASREEAFALAEPADGGRTTDAWRAIAAELDLIIIGGFAESAGDRLYNSSAMVLPDGRIETYRKIHLWDEEALWFEPGDLGLPIADTRHGRLGMLICYDGWFPETYRSLALRGVDIICVPTNWVPIPGQLAGAPGMATILTQAAAHSNAIVIAAADRVGTERGQEFIGQSVIVSHSGWPLAGPASPTDPDLLVASVDVAEARRSRAWGRFNNPVRDRRPEQYGPSA